MKSYKDLDKDIILNAPEGAMWVDLYEDGDTVYYKAVSSEVHSFGYDGWTQSVFYPTVKDVQKSNVIPLPNIEIPWEATEDSKCPVPYGTKVYIKWADYEYEDNNPGIWNWKTFDLPITSYKIIDEEYLPSEQEEDIVSYKLPLYTSADPLPCGNPLVELTTWPTKQEVREKDLIKRLEFLQNLANKFPEIRDEAIKFMSCELDGYMNTLWENDQSGT